MRGWVTINTDAGFYPDSKVGSFAYWIKGDNLFLKGSGLFKDSCKNSTDAEQKAIVNALHVLEASNAIVEKIIINRDNIYARSGPSTPIGKMMSGIIKRIKVRSIPLTHKNYQGKYVEFRHVKAHLHTDNPRHWVNDYLDKECKRILREWRKSNSNVSRV